jgi:uncharacterized repeat protein (TIGR03806 family)
LRLDVSDPLAPGGYTIPADNPVVVDGIVTAVYAVGVREPRALSVDPERSAVTFVDRGLVADELNILLPGRNYGWPRLDGRACHIAPADCSPFEYDGPSFLRSRDDALCPMVVGAPVGPASDDAFEGGVFYGDGCSPSLFGFLLDGYRVHPQVISLLDAPIATIGRGAGGGALVVDTTGRIVELAAVPDRAAFPTVLSDAGCFADLRTLRPVPSVVPYDLNAPLFSDGSDKHRFVAIPAGSAIGVAPDGAFDFPVGTVLLKVFAYGRPVETRVLVRRDDGWEAHTYRWNDEGTDAFLLSESEDLEVEVDLPSGRATATHLFPDRSGCAICHGFRPQSPIGPRLDQLDRAVTLESGDADQLRAFTDIGLFGGAPLPEMRPMPDPLDTTAPLDARARAYLHTNCGHCHRPAGWVPPGLAMDLRFDVPFRETATCDVPSDYSLSPIDRIEPGDPSASLLYRRMTTDGVERMPPLGVSLVDDAGSSVVRAFIEGMTGCE